MLFNSYYTKTVKIKDNEYLYTLYKEEDEVFSVKLKNSLYSNLEYMIEIEGDIYWIFGTYSIPLYVINLSNKKIIIDESYDYDGFIWASVKLLYGKYIIVHGCVWACPYETIIYKINEDSVESISILDFEQLENDDNYYNSNSCYNPNKKVSEFNSIEEFIKDKDTSYISEYDLSYEVKNDYLIIYGYNGNNKINICKLKLEYLL